MTPQVADIQTAVCEQFHIRMFDMTSDRRERAFSRPRQVAMYLCRDMTPFSAAVIARHFRREHSTVIHACRTVEQIMQRDPAFAAVVERLRYRISYPDQEELDFGDRAWRSYGA